MKTDKKSKTNFKKKKNQMYVGMQFWKDRMHL